MSHVGITLKVWAETDDEALSTALSELRDSVMTGEDGHNITGWDGVEEGETRILTKKDLKVYGLKSFAELERFLLQEQQARLAKLTEELSNSLKIALAPFLLSKKDAPLCLGDQYGDQFSDLVEKRLKAKRDIEPLMFLELTDKIARAIVGGLEWQSPSQPGGLGLNYLLKKIMRLQKAIEYPGDNTETLQCVDNHYAQINEKTKGTTAYYVFGVRHY